MRNVLFALFCAVCLLALVWPGYPLVGNRIQPLVLGMPFSLTWNVLWILLTFAALLAYHLRSNQRDQETNQEIEGQERKHDPVA